MEPDSLEYPEHDMSDEFNYPQKISTNKNLLQESVSSHNHDDGDENIFLNYSDIISDEEALDFLMTHFSDQIDSIDIESFLDALLQEFFLRNPSVLDTVEDISDFKIELRALLRKSLTTKDDEMVSLNALEVHTKKKGLYNFVFDFAKEAKNSLKLQKSSQINEVIVQELAVLSSMLNSKREELIKYEQKLQEYERSLDEREKNLKGLLQHEYEKLMKSFDESYKNSFNALLKKFANHEKSTKAKIKELEMVLKEMRLHATSFSETENKFKFKLSSLERTNEFLKLKAQELEKKVVQEHDLKQAESQKNQKLLSKVFLLERSIKESQNVRLSASQSVPRKTENEDMNYLEEDEKPLEIIDLHASHQKDWVEKEEDYEIVRSVSPDVREKNQLGSNKPKKDMKTVASKKIKIESQEGSPAPQKNKLSVSQSNSLSTEVRILLNVIHSLVACLKSTEPILMHSQNNEQRKGEMKEIGLSTTKQWVEEYEKTIIDLGELFYPCFDTLITNLTELIPVISKSAESKYISSIMEIYYSLINFSFKFRIQKKVQDNNVQKRSLSEYNDTQHAFDIIKTSQDPLYEIMNAGPVPQSSFDIVFIPLTEYWKRIMRISQNPQKTRGTSDLQSSVLHSLHKDNKEKLKKQNDWIRFFSDENVQKELLQIFKKYLESTEPALKSNSKSDKSNKHSKSLSESQINLNLESQKQLKMSRIYVSLTTLLLGITKSDLLLSLQSVLTDLNIENFNIAESLRLFFVHSDGLNIIFWLLQTRITDFDIIQLATDILLSLNFNGAHYQYFIESLSNSENIIITFDLLLKYGDNNEFCEKMCVIIQRITYHNSLEGKIPEKYVKFLKEKLKELEILKNNQFFIANIKSILLNLNTPIIK